MFSLGSLFVPLAIVLLAMPLVLGARLLVTRRGSLPDAGTMLLPQVTWYIGLSAVAALGIKTASLSNLVVELPLVSLVVCVVLAIRLRSPARLTGWPGFAVAMCGALTICVLVPGLPE